MPLVAGVDSSTQSTKIVICDSKTGVVVRHGKSGHPEGTEVDPNEWWTAFRAASESAGGLEDVSALSVAAQQHGLVCLDLDGRPVRKAILWNDMRSANEATDLVNELGGPEAWANSVGSVPTASFTITKLRWLAEHEPKSAARTAAIALPHDWLNWQLVGKSDFETLSTDRSDASGTGYWSPRGDRYRADLLQMAFGRDVVVPKLLGPSQAAGYVAGTDIILGPGVGDNAGAMLGLGPKHGDIVVSIGTSAVVSGVSAGPLADSTGLVACFADARDAYMPSVVTLNAVRVLDSVAGFLGVSHSEFSELALRGKPGAGGVVLVPYFDGERSPSKPDATGAIHGLTVDNLNSENIARAAIEGVLCSMADGIDALEEQGVSTKRVLLVGGGARSKALQLLAPTVIGRSITVPKPAEYASRGAALQAAWVLSGGADPPDWEARPPTVLEAPYAAIVRDQFAEAMDLVVDRPDRRG